ncbi:MAG: serine/threonine protein kinase [Dorea formicigenerans]|nr:serine/threonine protein kinase [Dorea formicigenerans]
MENFENIRLPWPEWEIVKYLGGGAYGVVYEIERNISGIQEKAALKIVSRPKDNSEIESYYDNGYDEASIISSYESEIRNYIKEYKLMKELQGQSNIVSCDDFKVVPHENGIGGDIFIRMELLTSLAQVLRKKEKLSEQEIIKLGKDISHALILCESKNIIHRDIKPANIMVSQFGDYKLGDFGVSKIMDHTTYATKMGTQEYQAPEVVHMEKYGHTADIYSLGITLYWLLNNRRMPFIDANGKITAELKDEAMDKRYRGEKLPAPKNGSDELKRIVLKACAYRPENRYASAQEMYDALDKIGIGYSTISSSNPAYGHPSVSSLEDDWIESGETVGKTVDDLSGRQTEENSWGGGGTIGRTIGRTIGKLKGNTEKKQKEVQEEPKTETIGVKKAYQRQEKKVEEKKAEEKKKITSENKLKKVKKTKFGYIWSFLVIGFCVFLAYEFWITKEGFVVLVDKVAGYDLGAYYFFHLSFAAFLFFMVLLQLMTKEDQKNIDGCAVVLMGGRLALVFLNIIGFGDLGIGVKRIVVLLILGFLFVCWKVGTELINCRCYDYEQQ